MVGGVHGPMTLHVAQLAMEEKNVKNDCVTRQHQNSEERIVLVNLPRMMLPAMKLSLAVSLNE